MNKTKTCKYWNKAWNVVENPWKVLEKAWKVLKKTWKVLKKRNLENIRKSLKGTGNSLGGTGKSLEGTGKSLEGTSKSLKVLNVYLCFKAFHRNSTTYRKNSTKKTGSHYLCLGKTWDLHRRVLKQKPLMALKNSASVSDSSTSL